MVISVKMGDYMKNNKYNTNKLISSVLTIVVILCIALFNMFFNQKNHTVTTTPGQQQEVTLYRTVDGDTAQLVVNGKRERIRFLLIDTPESVKENTPVQPFGKEASERVGALLKNAKKITLEYEPGEEKDDYDRLLAYVFLDGKMLQETIIEEGLARVAYFQGDEKYLKTLQAAQEKAKKKKIGVWSIDGYVTNRGFKE